MPEAEATSWAPYLLAVAIGLVLTVTAIAIWIERKNRPFMEGDVFRAHRLSRGNRIFPAQVAITPLSVVKYVPQFVGKELESIHISHVASVKIDTNLFFSDVVVETSGGSNPIVCHGHRKRHAVRMKELIEQYQAKPRDTAAGHAAVSAPPAPADATRVCPFCAETIKAAARVCRYCGRDIG
ncbi:MAG: hypothetical protein ACE148_01220 [Vicinamibacterales bacterium]